MPQVDLEEFQRRMEAIQELGYVKKRREGNKAIGNTLEDLLGIEENNHSEPDIAGVELKSHKISSNSKITIGTKEPQKANRRLWGDALAKEYGKENSRGKISARSTLKYKDPNSHGFYFDIDEEDDSIRIYHEEDGWMATYVESDIRKWIDKARNGIVLVDAKEYDDYFWYKSATRYSGWDADSFYWHLKEGNLVIGLRTRVGKNNGTAIRASNRTTFEKIYEETDAFLPEPDEQQSVTEEPYDLDWEIVAKDDEGEDIKGTQSDLSDYT